MQFFQAYILVLMIWSRIKQPNSIKYNTGLTVHLSKNQIAGDISFLLVFSCIPCLKLIRKEWQVRIIKRLHLEKPICPAYKLQIYHNRTYAFCSVLNFNISSFNCPTLFSKCAIALLTGSGDLISTPASLSSLRGNLLPPSFKKPR